jgi:hypothetical protein
MLFPALFCRYKFFFTCLSVQATSFLFLSVYKNVNYKVRKSFGESMKKNFKISELNHFPGKGNLLSGLLEHSG